MLTIVMLSVVMLSVMLNVVMLSVVAPVAEFLARVEYIFFDTTL